GAGRPQLGRPPARQVIAAAVRRGDDQPRPASTTPMSACERSAAEFEDFSDEGRRGSAAENGGGPKRRRAGDMHERGDPRRGTAASGCRYARPPAVAEMEEVSFVVRRPDTAEPIRHDLEQRAVAGAEIELVPAGPVEVQSHRVHNAVPGVEASSRPDVAVAKRSDRVEPRGIAGRSPDLGPRDHQPSCPGPAHDRGHWAEAAVDGSGPPDVTRGQRADAGDEAGNGD